MSDTVFTKVDYTLGALMDAVAMGTIGLPDIQRPFVWKNAKVRNLFDSMDRGYPVGYLLLWENANVEDSRTIGTGHKQKVPSLLIVDGQQRLTSLFAVVKGVPVVRENYASEQIEIAFSPLTEKFEVADAAIRRDKSFIPNISVLWNPATDLFELVDGYLEALGTAGGRAEEKRASRFPKLQTCDFPFTTLALAANIDEEQVSEVFVRINSEGKSLNQADFILTLMSVFWDEGRAQLEDFCRQARKPTAGKPSPFNHFIEPSPDQLLKVSVGVGFRRARLKAVYSVLRGKDLDTDIPIADRRDAQFAVLKQAQARVLHLQHWHDFLKSVMRAGFRSGRMISSQNNLLFAYMLYLLGTTEYGVEEYELRRLIAQWFFMTALTGRYSSSPESTMEFDLARFRQVRSDAFVGTLRRSGRHLASERHHPADGAAPPLRAAPHVRLFAALNLHDARVLFSDHKVSELMDPTTQAHRSSLERHHLFPKAHLASLGIVDTRETNQIANFTVVEWGDNTKIADKPPAEYVPELSARFSGKDLERMYYWHALLDGWEHMEYRDFLRQRRELMAQVIRDAYHGLAGEAKAEAAEVIPVDVLVNQGETTTVEFKSTLRINLHTGEKDPRMELSVLKTIAAFVNSSGGTLIIGVADDGNPVGIEVDQFPNEDKMYLHLVNLIKERMGAQHMMYIHPRFDDFDHSRVLVIECSPAKSPMFVKDGQTERFYMRTGAATAELTGNQAQDFIKQRFGG